MEPGFQIAQAQARRYESWTGLFMDGSARLLVAAAEIDRGDVVLDLACGTGLVTRRAWPLVGPTGRVVGVDVNGGMLDVARSTVDPSVELIEAPADDLPFDDGTFTQVICQQGLQFFSDPAAAGGEALRVLRPGGAFLASVWATPGKNPYIEIQLELLAGLDPALGSSLAGATPAAADEMLAATAASAGFVAIDITLIEHIAELPAIEDFFLEQTASTPWASTLDRLSNGEQRELASDIARRLDEYRTHDGTYRVPFCSYCLLARRGSKPSPSERHVQPTVMGYTGSWVFCRSRS